MLTYMQRTMIACLLVSVVFWAAGCGNDSGDSKVHVSGTVTFTGGATPKWDIAAISFEPFDGDVMRTSSGDIQNDGSFKLLEGAFPGEYKVYLNVLTGYGDANPQSLLAEKYGQAVTTPLTATVESGGGSNFNFTVELRQ